MQQQQPMVMMLPAAQVYGQQGLMAGQMMGQQVLGGGQVYGQTPRQQANKRTHGWIWTHVWGRVDARAPDGRVDAKAVGSGRVDA